MGKNSAIDLVEKAMFVLRLKKPQWEYIPEGWKYLKGHPEVKGWGVEKILDVYRKKWPFYASCVSDKGPVGITLEMKRPEREDVFAHNINMSFSYALGVSALGKSSISMLDWGGGIGQYYFLAKEMFPRLDISYTCKDHAVFTEHGKTLFPDQVFVSDESCLNGRYDLVMAGTSLHYSEDWRKTLRDLARVTEGYIYVAQLPVVFSGEPFVFIQRPYKYGYGTEYLSWCLNGKVFLRSAADAGLELVREFIYGYKPRIYRAPEECGYRGYLFKSAGNGDKSDS
ncbi:MAG: hypothetical protein HQL30_03555 [Candidatus Omnitrophica bacterium]|nr:hypothetical protein [Candidatus Omnitrophota bacterium]